LELGPLGLPGQAKAPKLRSHGPKGGSYGPLSGKFRAALVALRLLKARSGPARQSEGLHKHALDCLVRAQGKTAGRSGLESEMDFGEVKIRR